MRMLPTLLFALVPFASALAEESLAQKAFRDLATLVGEWSGTSANRPLRVSYKLTANGTALVETWTMSATRESMTLYTVDGSRLLATHYCPQGNQPRLVLTEKDKTGRYQFRFMDGTGLQDPGGSHQHACWLQVVSPETFIRSETYIPNHQPGLDGTEKDEPITFHRQPKAK
ncbi:hypothetical protein [Geothrix sp. PMB-07]|uniref:hypothetical protein n=1 Tax=Geothrix sp. PMB-07 TaxID=3068640 RepID=UPI002741205C|nr:hypothetical protein [Geothrix sp. PMB-07]WLT32945.1 hypothetical protein Q9293_06350 [Geothrix sp. PMB-07]